MPSAPSPVKGKEISLPSCSTGAYRLNTFRIIET